MNPFATDLNQPTMSSLEIAELTGMWHSVVLHDIRKMIEELGLIPSEFSDVVSEDTGDGTVRTIEVFNLTKRECLNLIADYDDRIIDLVIDRWRELESGLAQPVAAPNFAHSYADAVAGAEIVARMLRLDDSAALGMVRKATEIMAPHLLPMLPANSNARNN